MENKIAIYITGGVILLVITGILIWYFIRNPKNNGCNSNKAKANGWDNDKCKTLSNLLSIKSIQCENNDNLCTNLIKNTNIKNCIEEKLSPCVASYIAENNKYDNSFLTKESIMNNPTVNKEIQEGTKNCENICLGVKGEWNSDFTSVMRNEINQMFKNNTNNLDCIMKVFENNFSPTEFIQKLHSFENNKKEKWSDDVANQLKTCISN